MCDSSESSGSGDAFDPSPIPAKRRRISTTSATSTDQENQARSRGKKRQLSTKTDETPKGRKPKHRVIVHERPVAEEEEFLTQPAQDVPSSPWRLRGPKWTKPAKTAQEPVTKVNTVAGTGDELAQSDVSIEDDFALADIPKWPSETQAEALPSLTAGDSAVTASKTVNVDAELADLPSDAFASSSSSPQLSPQRAQRAEPIFISSQNASPSKRNLVAPRNAPVQRTLYGQPAKHSAEDALHLMEENYRFNWPAPEKDEPPTHHKLDTGAVHSWIYPTNIGSIRDYQYNIVQRGLFSNLLVALPTGLGKTFIAATIMLNWYRWTKDAQIVFVAPTKPLVAQQVNACFGIAGIPRSETTMLTGGIQPGLRAEEWSSKRVFFTTPQTVHHDFQSGIADPKKLVLLVVDEAHRATGNYAYVKLVKFIRRFNPSFRVLALTATPGNSVEAVQEVINGLDIARVEIRTETSLDIRQYVHSRKTDRKVFSYSDEMELIMDWFSKALQPVLNMLLGQNAYWEKDPLKITPYGLTQARQRWNASDTGRRAHMGVKAMVNRIFSLLASLGHNLELLKYHGLGPFYHNMVRFRNESQFKNGGKYENMIKDHECFQKMMTRLQFWINNPDFIGHPKLEYLQELVLAHFAEANDVQEVQSDNQQPARSTRIMVFAHFRDSAEEIVRVLKRHQPMIKPHVFVGQTASKGSEGMDQKKQQEIIAKFKSGEYNTLIATSIGEEGLDIGEVDLIVCYDSSSSPIRMLQRMGRTGRKRAGNIVLLLMRGKEEESFVRAKDNYEKMQAMISNGDRFEFHDDRSPRVLPKDVNPVPEPRHVEIPVENTQAALPEPTKKGRRAPKKPAKKFHMPDNVRTGFVRASRLDGDSDDDDSGLEASRGKRRLPRGVKETDLAPIPTHDSVILTPSAYQNFERTYLQIHASSEDVVVSAPSADACPHSLRELGSTSLIKHSHATNDAIRTVKYMRSIDSSTLESWKRQGQTTDLNALCGPVRAISKTPASSPGPPPAKKNRGRPKKSTAATTTTTATTPKRTTKKPTTTTTSKPRGRPPKKTITHPAPSSDMDAAPSSPPATDPRFALPSQSIPLGSSDTSGDDNVEEEEMESSLRAFVVGSDAVHGLDADDDVDGAQAGDGSADEGSSSLPDVDELFRSKGGVSPASRRLSQAMCGGGERGGKRKRRVVEESDGDG